MIPPRCAGLVQVDEGRQLHSLARMVPPERAVVEIGSHTGLSTCWMAHRARAHIFAVDPWGDPRPETLDDPFGLVTGDAVLDVFLGNIRSEGYESRVTPIRGRSLDVARLWVQPIGLLFIDAIHTYEAVLADIDAWAPHLAPGAFVVFHDWTPDPEHPYGGVKVAVDERSPQLGWHSPALTNYLYNVTTPR